MRPHGVGLPGHVLTHFLHNTTASQSTKPFCTLTLGKITRQTQIVEKTASPTWNEVYNLYLPKRACVKIGRS